MSERRKRPKPVVFVNGKRVSAPQALVPLFDEGYLSVFESIKSCQGILFQLEAHLDRLFESARTIGFNVPRTRSELKKELENCMKHFKNEDKFVRLMLDKRNSYIFITDRKRPRHIYDEGVRLRTLVTRRNLVHAVPPEIKSNAFVNNVLATIDFITSSPSKGSTKNRVARDGRAFDGVFLDVHGNVVEATTWNIFAIKDGKLLTAETGFLRGVTRQFVIKCAALERLPVLELGLTRHDVWNADEAFLTTTSGEILPIRSLDGRTIGHAIPGRVTKQLMRRFRNERDKELKYR